MSEESNVCEICGGWLRIAYTIEFRQCTPHSISVDPQVAPAPFKLCPGHPEPVTKHDGKLDEGGTVIASYCDPIYSITGPEAGVCLEETFGPAIVGFTYKQALSLLRWLEQEKEALERLAKEQE